MAEQKTDGTGITWCDYTFNPWMGCSKISPACKFCYAERDFDHRYKKVQWGPSGTRVLTSDANWRKPLKWNRGAGVGMPIWNDGRGNLDRIYARPRVFCASLADVFEDWHGPILNNQGMPLWICEGVDEWQAQVFPGRTDAIMRAEKCRRVTMDDVRTRLFRLIDATPHLDWLLLTKRPKNIRKMWPEYPHNACLTGDCPHERADQCSSILDRENVWLGTSVENQEFANMRIPELLKCRDLSPVLFLSCEPLLGPLDLRNIQIPKSDWYAGPDAIADDLLDCLTGETCSGETGCLVDEDGPAIDWVIAGGESGPGARPSHPDWFRSLRDQCQASGVPFHFKQWGEFRPPITEGELQSFKDGNGYFGGLGLGGFFEDPHGNGVLKVGKKNAGRLLDGREWSEFPEVSR